MTEQAKREAGASRKAERRQRIDVTLPQWAVEYLDKQALSRSRFIELLIETHRDVEQAQAQFFTGLQSK
jgi:hypothetical protein